MRLAMFSTIPAQLPSLSKEVPRPREGTLNRAVKAECVRSPSATTIMAERQGAIRHEEAPASVVGQGVAPLAEGMAGAVNQVFLYAPGDPEMRK